VNVKVLRRRCEERLRELELPAPFDAATFCDALAERRGRPIVLQSVVARGGPFGFWVPTPNRDYIFYERETSRWHQEHIVLHEACHMLWGHEPTSITDPDLAQLLVPNVAPETVRRMLQRRAYPEEQEHEAELLATLILERVGGIGASGVQRRRTEPNDPVVRLEAILDGGSERSRD
jgi:hypothetical protein